MIRANVISFDNLLEHRAFVEKELNEFSYGSKKIYFPFILLNIYSVDVELDLQQ